MELKSVLGKPVRVSESFAQLVSSKADVKPLCPACGLKGFTVMKVTVSNHVDPAFWRLLGSEWFWFCPNPACDVVYYNNELGLYFLKEEVRSRVFHKERDPGRPVCYCLSVTEEMIREEIFVKRCCDSLESIQRFTGAGTGRWCPITNPSGKCCKEYLAGLVDSLVREASGEGLRPRLEEIGRSFRLEIPSKPQEGGAIVLVEGMSCEGCAVAVRAALENSGASVKAVDWRSGLVEISRLGGLKAEDVKSIIEGIGYRVVRIVGGG